jgi:YesN/AraC family two-component response regulator
MKILIADDSQLILDRLQEMLSDFKGAEIVAALKNGLDSLELIKDLSPDLVIIDINMPKLTGLQVLEAAKKENHKVIFIILTFYASKYFREKAISLGADYFFSKADDFEKVSEVVSNLLALEDKNRIQIN